MAFHAKNYVGWWKQFSEYVRFVRAENRCECVGECGERHEANRCFATNDWPGVCLTVAHLDHADGQCRCKKKYGFKCARPDHCKAMCQACHLRMDRFSHLQARQENLRNKKDSERGLLVLTSMGE